MYSRFWYFEVQCDSTSYRSPEEAPAAITFGLPDAHPSQNQTEPQALCVDSWHPDGTCSKWLYCRLGGDPSLPRYSDCIASYIPTGLLQHWYQLQVRAHAPAALNWSSGTRIAVWQLSLDTCVDARLWGPDSSKLGNPSARVVASALIICYLIKYISEGVWLCVFVDLFSLFLSAIANCQIFQDGAHCLLGRGKFDWGVDGLQFQNRNRFGTQPRQGYWTVIYGIALHRLGLFVWFCVFCIGR